MKKIVGHLVRDPSNPFGDDTRVYACQFEDGTFVSGLNNVYGVGNGSVILMPCIACNSEITSQTISPILRDAAKNMLKQESRKLEIDETIFYRSYVLTPYEGYSFPRKDTEEYQDILAEMDKYIDQGKPANLRGIDIKTMASKISESI